MTDCYWKSKVEKGGRPLVTIWLHTDVKHEINKKLPLYLWRIAKSQKYPISSKLVPLKRNNLITAIVVNMWTFCCASRFS